MGQVLALAISAVLLAGFYASMAYGLGLIYGVLRVVNLAHGGMIMAAAYLSWVLFTRFSIDPYLAIPVVMVVFFFIGVAMYKGLVRFLPRGAAGGVQSLLLLFGVWLVIRNIAYLLFTGDDQAVRTSYSSGVGHDLRQLLLAQQGARLRDLGRGGLSAPALALADLHG